MCRHEDFEVKVKNEGENEIFHNFYHVHRDPEVFLHHICRDKFSLDNPFNARKINNTTGYLISLTIPE